MAQRNEDLQRSNRELEQFAYVASHDLQEPLRMVASYVQLLELRYADVLDEDGKQFIAYAVDGAGRMESLIKDLLAFSRIGRASDPLVATDLNPLVRSVLHVLGPAIAAANATVTLGDLPVVEGDPAQLPQLFQNLISNALKFRGEQPPRVAVNASLTGEEWTLVVSDNGIGIDPEHRERIFQMFQRLHARGHYDGTGIGLAICRGIVERHHGESGWTPQPTGAPRSTSPCAGAQWAVPSPPRRDIHDRNQRHGGGHPADRGQPRGCPPH